MKIFHILPTLVTAGAESFVVALANVQAEQHDVTILVLSEPTPEMFMKERIGPKVRLLCLDKKPGADLSLPFKLLRLLAKEKPDIVNTHLRSIYYTAPAQILLRIPSFHTIHNMADKEVGQSYRRLLNVLFNYFGFTAVSISPRVLESTQALYGEQHRLLIDNGIDRPQLTDELETTRATIDALKPSPNSRVLLNIGRVSKQKNQELLLRAVDALRHQGYDLVLLILGDLHEETDRLQALRKELGLEKNVHFLGTRSNIADYLHCAEFFCLSSAHEGLPITLLEAICIGTPPICTPVGGIPDVIEDSVTGFLSDDVSFDAYCATLRRALNTEQSHLNDMKDAMRKLFATHYAIEHCAALYLDAYENRLTGRSVLGNS